MNNDILQLISELSLFFDGLESLLEPLIWQHSVIPALSPQHLEFLEAPTPFLMGLLLQLDGKDVDDELVDAAEEWWREELKPIVEADPQCMVLLLRAKGTVRGKIKLREPLFIACHAKKAFSSHVTFTSGSSKGRTYRYCSHIQYGIPVVAPFDYCYRTLRKKRLLVVEW